MKIHTKVITKVLTILVYALVVACQPQEKAPLLLDTPENAVRTLRESCSDGDIEGVLTLYEATSRQKQSNRIAEMRRDAVAAGISQRDQDGVALAMLCIPVSNTEPDHIETNFNGDNATVLYVYNKDSLTPVMFQIDLVQQGVVWMITDVDFNPSPQN